MCSVPAALRDQPGPAQTSTHGLSLKAVWREQLGPLDANAAAGSQKSALSRGCGGPSAAGLLKRLGEETSEELLSDTSITKARLPPDPAAGQCALPPPPGRGLAQGSAQRAAAKPTDGKFSVYRQTGASRGRRNWKY